MKTRITALLTVLIAAIILFGSYMAIAGSQSDIAVTTSSTSYDWWNTNASPKATLYIKQLKAHWTAAANNTFSVHHIDASTNLYLIETTTYTTNLQDMVITPTGNGEIVVPYGNGLRFTQAVGSQYRIIISPYKPE